MKCPTCDADTVSIEGIKRTYECGYSVSESFADNDWEIHADCPKFIERLSAQMADMDDPTVYLIESHLLGRIFFDVTTETWCSDIKSATMFKRYKHARAICRMLSSRNTVQRYNKEEL